MTLFYWTIYIAGALVSMRFFYTLGFKHDYQDSVERNYMSGWPYTKEETELKRIKSARGMGLFASWAGLFWPIAWPLFAAFLFIARPTSIEKDIEARKKAAEFDKLVNAEMVSLRRLLREGKIPVPDDEILRGMAEENVKKNV